MRSANQIAYYRDRCTPPLTQAELASAAGVSLNSIKNWERAGCPKPGNLLRLLEVFLLHGAIHSRFQAQRFWERSGIAGQPFPIPLEFEQLFVDHPPDERVVFPQSLPPYATFVAAAGFTMPRNPLFVGRDQALLAIAQQLQEPLATLALTGIGGVGKTQLAAEFAHRYGQFFPGGVFWLNMQRPASALIAIVESGRSMGLFLDPNVNSIALEMQARQVLLAWQDAIPRLLIFDNCDDEELLANWKPVTGGCRILLTSRRASWNSLLVSATLTLDQLPRHESVRLLQALARREDQGAATTFEQIAALLGDLPLGLYMAGSFLRQHQALSPAHYLDDLRHRLLLHDSLAIPLKQHLTPTHYQHALSGAMTLSYARLDYSTMGQQARHLLAYMLCFAPGVPIPLLLLCLSEQPEQLDDTSDEQLLDAVLQQLRDHGMLSPGGHDHVRLHSLIHAFLLQQPGMPAHREQLRPLLERRVFALARYADNVRNSALMRQLHPHLRLLADEAYEHGHVQAIELSYWCAWHLCLFQQFDLALSYAERVHRLNRERYGDSHEEVAGSYNLLGLISQMNTHFVEAQNYLQAAQYMLMQLHGPLHGATAMVTWNLGYLLVLRGNYAWARRELCSALCYQKHIQSRSDLNTARILHSLGFALLRQGRLYSARRCLFLALHIREQYLPRSHTSTLSTRMFLGDVCFQRGQLEDAEKIYQQIYTLCVAAEGPESGLAGEMLYRIGRIRIARHEFDEGLRHYRAALAMLEASVGMRNIDSIWCRDELAETYAQHGMTQEALALYPQVLEVYQSQLIPGHADTLRVAQRMAALQAA